MTSLSVQQDRQGRIWVFESESMCVFDRNGKFLRVLGRKGAGPNEYLWATGMFETPVIPLSYSIRGSRAQAF
ncbi:MAG: 6-bladed beta-propeller [Gemmatimonas sp.]